MRRSSSTPAGLPQIKPTDLIGFHGALQHWYQAHGRHDLPWRLTRDPYAIWVSETMLQQTQVETVRARFYAPFLKKFPTVQLLAAAPREQVMKAWEGLGYYRRAGHLHEAAKRVVTGDGWEVTSDARVTRHPSLATLLALPGVGRNTAHAILAFAYHQPVAILEANVKRIVARIFALSTASDAELWAGAEALLNHANPFDYNQSMMDLGAQICTPKAPDCTRCPAQKICRGKHAPEVYPTPKRKKSIPVRHVAIELREDERGRFYLKPREDALLGGLYGFPQMTHPARHRQSAMLGTVTHSYSHFKLVGEVYHAKRSANPSDVHWHTRTQIQQLPLSVLDRKVFALVETRHTGQKKAAKSTAKRRPH